MKIVRQNMFETNSSSAHSIVIAHGDCNDTLKPTRGVVTVMPGEFGWEVANYDDAMTKASYCLTYAKSFPDEAKVDMLRKVIANHTGAAQVKFACLTSEKDEYGKWGEIDHQSLDKKVCGPAFQSEESLRQFIFNKNSILHTDNDNHE